MLCLTCSRIHKETSIHCPTRKPLKCKYCSSNNHIKKECPLIYCKHCGSKISRHYGPCQQYTNFRTNKYIFHIGNMDLEDFIELISNYFIKSEDIFIQQITNWLKKNDKYLNQQYSPTDSNFIDYLHDKIKTLSKQDAKYIKNLEFGLILCRDKLINSTKSIYKKIRDKDITPFVQLIRNLCYYNKVNLFCERAESILGIQRTHILMNRINHLRKSSSLKINKCITDNDLLTIKDKEEFDEPHMDDLESDFSDIEDSIEELEPPTLSMFCNASKFLIESKLNELNYWQNESTFISFALKLYFQSIEHHKYCTHNKFSRYWFGDDPFIVKECWCKCGLFECSLKKSTKIPEIYFKPNDEFKDKFLSTYKRCHKKDHWYVAHKSLKRYLYTIRKNSDDSE